MCMFSDCRDNSGRSSFVNPLVFYKRNNVACATCVTLEKDQAFYYHRVMSCP